jgi:hypothetical protein
VAEYGPPESNRSEGFALLLLVSGLAMWVGGFAYAASVLQVILAAVGIALDLGALVVFYKAKVAGDAERAARG